MIGIVIPTFVIIIILGTLLGTFQHNVYVQAALQGIRPVVVALIASAAFKMGKVSLVDKICIAIFIICLAALMMFKNLNLILVIFAGAFVGIAIMKIREARNKATAREKAGETL